VQVFRDVQFGSRSREMRFQREIMKTIVTLCLFLFVFSASAAVVTNTFSAQGTGSVVRNIDTNFEYGVGDDFVSGSSGSVLLTAPGAFQYQTKDTTDASINNRYNESGYSQFDNGGVGSDSVSMESSSPAQYASVDHSWILQTAEIQTAKFVSDSNLSMGQQASWDGAGLYTRDAEYGVGIISTKDGKSIHYRSDQTDHSMISTNSTGGAIVRPEFSFTGFEDSFAVNKTENVTQTNLTGVI
jgi:hypothetical protein